MVVTDAVRTCRSMPAPNIWSVPFATLGICVFRGFGLGERQIVYVPAHPDLREGQRNVMFETRTVADGSQVGVAFSTQDLLVAALGPAQPWVALNMGNLQAVLGTAGLTTILLDPQIDESVRWWTPESVEALAAEMRRQHG